VDSGATDNFMHPVFTKKMGLGLQELPTPKKFFNIDNTTNKSGKITHYLDLNVCTKDIYKKMGFLVTDIGSEDLLLGYPWLATHSNPNSIGEVPLSMNKFYLSSSHPLTPELYTPNQS
jgi:hypothetical protein